MPHATLKPPLKVETGTTTNAFASVILPKGPYITLGQTGQDDIPVNDCGLRFEGSLDDVDVAVRELHAACETIIGRLTGAR